MHIVTLLSAPQSPNLDPMLVESLRNAWGGGVAVWLSPDEAAEFEIPEMPANRWDVWQDVQGMGVDLVIQPAKNRRKAVLIADMDSTMIQQECIDELADEAGVGAQVADITARAMNAELDFEDALIERVGLLKGLKTAVIDTVIANRITLMPGAQDLLATMKNAGAYTALVSGGFTAFTAAVANQLGFDENRANVLGLEGDHLNGLVKRPILGRDAKVSAMQDISARLGISHEQIMAVGDGANDLGMLGAAGSGVALHAKPIVAQQCDIRINHGDLSALLFLQGYSRAEFVT